MSRRFGTVPFINGMFVNVLKPRLLVIDLKLESCVVKLFLPCGIYIVSWKTVHLSLTHVLFQEHLFQGSVPF